MVCLAKPERVLNPFGLIYKRPNHLFSSSRLRAFAGFIPYFYRMSFQDHFSKQAEIYLKARPTYPDELYDYLAGISPTHNLCWDCATGNGQAAVPLAKHFKKVIATDGSKSQIDNAVKRENIEYRVGTAEESGLEPGSVDLITVAQAAHWFKLDLFYKEAQRIMVPNGVLAIWTYSEARINKELDDLMEWFMYDLLHDYWPDGRWLVRGKYEALEFPFEQLPTPQFYCRLNWNKLQMLDYVRSWSSYNKYVSKHGTDPIEMLLPKLNLLWNDRETKLVEWPLHMKCAKLNSR